jgi:hypothetical protein
MIFEFSRLIFENTKVKIFLIKISMEAEIFYADGQLDVSKLTVSL